MTTCGWHRHSEARDKGPHVHKMIRHSLTTRPTHDTNSSTRSHACVAFVDVSKSSTDTLILPAATFTYNTHSNWHPPLPTHTHTVIHKTNSLTRELIHSYRISLAENAPIGSSNNDLPCRAANGPSPVSADGGLPPPSLISKFSAYIYVSCRTN